MHPSASFSNNKSISLKPKIEPFLSSNLQLPDRFTINNKSITQSRPSSFRKPVSKSKSDFSYANTSQSKNSNSKKNTPRDVHTSHSSINSQATQPSEKKPLEIRPSVVPKHTNTPYSIALGSRTPTNARAHLRNRSQNTSNTTSHNTTAIPKEDENPCVNRIPCSPISIKRAVSPQMGMGSIDDLPDDDDNTWTENSATEGVELRQNSVNLPTYHTVKGGSIDITRDRHLRVGYGGNHSTVALGSPMEYNSVTSLHDITNSRYQAYDSRHGGGMHSVKENLRSIKVIADFPPTFSREGLSSLSYRTKTEMNQSHKQPSPVKIMHTAMNTEIKDPTSILRSPGRGRRDQPSSSGKMKPSPIKVLDHTHLKTASTSTLQTSPMKGRLTQTTTNGRLTQTSTNNENATKSTSTLDEFKAYFNKFNTFDLKKSTSMIRQIFQPKKRLKCSCDINLDENESCSKALNWISKKYKTNEFGYLKATYEKILSENKLVDIEYARQIQKDLPRTSPQNKYFAEGSPGIKSLENVLNTFAKYDPQIGYVQGMNFIAASLLFHADEYVTFWILVMIFEIFEMRDIYLPRLPGLSKHCQIIDMLIFNYQPSIYLHLCEHEIKVDVFCTEWILALFASVIPVENMANFYDILLSEGWPFFYKIILAFLQHFEKQIKAEDDLVGILTVLKSQNHIIKNAKNGIKNPMTVDWNNLFQKAQKIEIDSYFIYKMHSNFDADNQWFRTSFLENK